MPADDLQQQLLRYLEDVDSTEQNAITQLRDGADRADDQELASAVHQHLAETEEHERLISERLEAYGSSPSALKDSAQTGAAKLSE